MSQLKPINNQEIDSPDLLEMAIERLAPMAGVAAQLRAAGIRLVASPAVVEQLRQRGEAGARIAASLWLVDDERIIHPLEWKIRRDAASNRARVGGFRGWIKRLWATRRSY